MCVAARIKDIARVHAESPNVLRRDLSGIQKTDLYGRLVVGACLQVRYDN